MFEQTRLSFDNKKRQRWAEFQPGSINNEEIDACVGLTKCKKPWEFANRLYKLTANSIIYPFNVIFYINLPETCFQGYVFLMHIMFSTYAPPVVFSSSCFAFVVLLSAEGCALSLVQYYVRDGSVVCISYWQW